MNNLTIDRQTEIAKLFFKLGIIGFGGPAVHISIMEDEVVKRRQWLTREQFLDILGATNLIPGPNSTEMAIHIGYIRGGWLGLIIAGVCFIVPAVTITAIFAWIYVKFGQLPQVTPFLSGIKPVVLAIILNAIWRLGKSAFKSRKMWLIAIPVAGATWLGLNEAIALLLGGFLGMFWLQISDKFNQPNNNLNSLLITLPFSTLLAKVTPFPKPENIPLWQLGLFFLKVGSVLFGGGYLLIAFLEGELVGQYHWLTKQQLLDAIAVGQFTPGPILSTATFIGYVISGIPGAIVATIGIFLPSFLFVLILNPLIPLLRNSQWTAAFLDAVNVSAVALMAVVILRLATVTLVDPIAILLAIIAAILTIGYHVNPAWLVLGGGFIGWLLSVLIKL
ncbi:chromate efflux transporter [Aerosakkonemataceae cyanobacterium BLCC-F154]|uniref:Chromate efflux transporter n=1 Tax=Floridaenema fluviatile BLCC-F154 TaxID=3153640 RepID=A0ABV4YC08_9CYAN